MEPRSGPSRRRCGRRQGRRRLLLAASLLTFWIPPTTTQVTIETVPPLAAEGSNVLLVAHNVTEKTLCYFWYRGERVEDIQLIASYGVATNFFTNGPAHSGQETLYPNGTLLIQNITQKHTGSYTLLILKFALPTERQTGHLHVHHPVAWPSLHMASNTTVAEHEGPVVLTCLTDETGVSICWFFQGQSLLLTRGMTLSLDSSTLTIDPVSRKDTGDYQCEVSNRGNSSKSDPFRLHVKYKPTPESSSDLSAGAFVGIVIGAVAGVALIAALVYFLYIRGTRWSSHSDSSPEKVNEVKYSSLNFNAQEFTKQATSAFPTSTDTETIQN